ncbi:MAG: hypothetical protein ABGZ17_23175 [Planctomycetaceae bacterium]
MKKNVIPSETIFEVFLIVVSIGLSCLMYKIDGYKMVVLNLFFLPTVLSAFFLGRYRAGVLALFCLLAVSVVTAIDLRGFAAYNSPIVIGLAVTVWGAVLGLTTLLVGTLSDERTEKIHELHEAYIGVVEVMSCYLHSADPKMRERGQRISELSQQVAMRMRLSSSEVDDIRVAALLLDMENVELTARVISKAMGDLEFRSRDGQQNTFYGTDVIDSLGVILTGALPLLGKEGPNDIAGIGERIDHGSSYGRMILHTVSAVDDLMYGSSRESSVEPLDALRDLREHDVDSHHPNVLRAVGQVLDQQTQRSGQDATPREPRPTVTTA